MRDVDNLSEDIAGSWLTDAICDTNVVFVTRDMGHGVVSNCDIEVQSLLQDAFIREFL